MYVCVCVCVCVCVYAFKTTFCSDIILMVLAMLSYRNSLHHRQLYNTRLKSYSQVIIEACSVTEWTEALA